ncbi:MAG: hypothetical protein NE330_19955 [Lentisphaeraceae bacterium]|nr:hypothetical protein [Lentisphaeraceae bacterium]
MRFLICLLVFSISTFSFADNAEKVKKLEAVLTKHKADKEKFEKHFDKLVTQLKTQDVAIEKEVKGIIDFIKQFKDSNNSKNRILRDKERVISGLKKSIKNYSDRRQRVINEMKFGHRILDEDLEKVKVWFDKKIELRVKQVVEIAQSLGTYKDYGYNRSREQKNVEKADKEKQRLIKEMEKGVENLTEKAEKLERELDNVNSKLTMAEIADELTATTKKVNLLKESIDELWKGGKNGKAVSSTASSAIDRELRKKINEVRGNAYTFFRQFDSAFRMLEQRKKMQATIDKYEFAIEQLK